MTDRVSLGEQCIPRNEAGSNLRDRVRERAVAVPEERGGRRPCPGGEDIVLLYRTTEQPTGGFSRATPVLGEHVRGRQRDPPLDSIGRTSDDQGNRTLGIPEIQAAHHTGLND